MIIQEFRKKIQFSIPLANHQYWGKAGNVERRGVALYRLIYIPRFKAKLSFKLSDIYSYTLVSIILINVA